ncbi:hypothetical protein EOM89_11955, partial [Candidatus Falkowbacteria bacterium]|nr:hypothetical protein [Candidatus Falkowbacteria bacterium]
EALRRIMVECPLPVFIFSSLAQDGASVTLKALEYGAVDYLAKPMAGAHSMGEVKDEIVAKLEHIALRNRWRMGGAAVKPVRVASESKRPLDVSKRGVDIIAVGSSTGGVQAGVADSLGARGVQAAGAPLALLLGSSDATVAEAAANALGRIGGTASIAALTAAQPTPAIARAVLACGEAARKAGRQDEATTAYAWLLLPEHAPDFVAAAAFYGQGMVAPAKGLADALAAATGDNREMVRAAASLARDLPGDAVASSFAQLLPSLPATVQPLFLDALAERGDRAVQPTVLALVKGEDENVRLTALEALAKLGDAAAVPELVAMAAQADGGKVADAARQSLSLLTPANVDAALVAILAKDDAPVQTEVVRALGARKAATAVPALLGTARSGNRDLAKESRKSLALLTQPQDLPEIVKLLSEQKSASARGDLENILIAVAKRIDDDQAKTAAILPALKGELSSSARASLLDVLGRIGADSG